ncbi:AraC family transcriptional regulator [Vibrio coralliilyticus]|uniref:AraC family transcriptional regulator n=1 Tax=Vibrio coralliilyticus TaxID=190893 RepID=UPI00240A79DA|nr:AraC family transcriptional regulator [Vibrio coralliilyticus]WFB47388.1 helix-turn-helix domain-containing protein [Vibrio coralliilyticus]
MKQAVCFLSFLFLTRVAMAMDLPLSVFYPLPTQSQGKAFAAKELFLADNGGIWFQDVRNQVLFFDGQNILPKSGSALDFESEQVAFLGSAFWSFAGNEIYRTTPGKSRELIFSLTPGTEILRIGVSNRYVWVSDASNFYTYHVDSGEFSSYSLMELYQYNQSAQINITDAKLIQSKWVLATNSGVYLSDGSHFEHAPRSGTSHIETLYFSEKRQELVVGTRHGAIVFNFNHPDAPLKRIPGGHVLSIAETQKGYWIGTESGLQSYSFASQESAYFAREHTHSHALFGEKVYSLLNDHRGGMWIATERGIHYFSLFAHHFKRFPDLMLTRGSASEKLIQLTNKKSRSGFWMVTNVGVYSLKLNHKASRKLLYKGRVNDVIEHNGVLWLATENGIICIDSVSGTVIADRLPNFLKTSSVELLELDNNGRIWGASDHKLWRFDTQSRELMQYGSEWMLNKYLPAQVTQMAVADNGSLILGTDHGTYVLINGQIHYVSASEHYGRVASIKEVNGGEIWVASTYGLYQLDAASLQLKSLTMVDDHITPKCLISNRNGVWMTSSAGLTHYAKNGQIAAHYGEPLGLVNNEFQSGLCSSGSESLQNLLIGSRRNLIKVDTKSLSASKSPNVQVIYSQVVANQDLYSLGGSVLGAPHVTYGESIAFQFGVLPQVSNVSLQYRLGEQDEWQNLEGMKLTIEHILPGDYALEVRAVNNGMAQSAIEPFVFSVDEPWYIRGYAIFSYVTAVFILLALVIYWRSRMMARTNKDLRSQVALKTNQLRHQSRILLTNNDQLRKQLQIRRILYRQSVQSLRERLQGCASQTTKESEQGKQQLLRFMIHELDLLLNVRAANGDALPVYNLSLVLRSALDGWQEELIKAGLSVEVHSEEDKDIYVTLDVFNLDSVFNLLIDNLIKRSYRGQVVLMRYRINDGEVSFSMTEQGAKLDDASLTPIELWNEIESLVKENGGSFHRYSSDERNLIEFVWPVGSEFEENSIVELTDTGLSEKQSKDPWIEKLEALVVQHYSDPEFGTASAAKQMYVSERSLQRRFKSAAERTFMDYVTEVRLDYACRRLLAGEKISDVAFECGFNDPSYFSQRFKHRFGVSPSQFIEDQDR